MCAVIAVTLFTAAVSRADEPVNLGRYYGFEPLQIYKVETRSQGMVAGDLNNDQLTDLVLIDNSHSRLDLFIQLSKDDAAKEPVDTSDDVNAVPNDRGFRHDKLQVDEQVTTIALGDFNHDGLTDIAYIGTPDQLLIRYQSKDAGERWTKRYKTRLPNLSDSSWTMAAGDLNSDGRTDLVVLGESLTYVLLQSKNGEFGTPLKIRNTSESLGLVQIADVNGDGKSDLVYSAEREGERTLCVRLQVKQQLGPELQFDLNQPRSLAVGEVDKRAGKEILSVDSRTNRVKVYRLDNKPKPVAGEPADRLVQYGFGDTGSGKDRDLALGDIDGDGRSDVVVSDPSAAQILTYRQQTTGGLSTANVFPSLIGVTQLRSFDFDGDKRAEVVVLSPKEQTLGISRFENGRLTFPTSIRLPGEPQAFELADLDGKGLPELFCIVKSPERDIQGIILRAKPSGEKTEFEVVGEPIELDISSTTTRLVRFDANQDGRPDFLAFAGLGRVPTLLVTNEKGIPEVVKTDEGVELGDISAGSIFVRQLTEKVGDKNAAVGKQKESLLVARDGFAREMQLSERQWTVADQYNAAESGADIVGVASLDLDGQPGEEIVLVDVGIKRLRLLRSEDGLFQPWREIELGDFPFLGTRVADLDGDGKQDLLLFGKGRFAVLSATGGQTPLKELASFESKLERAFFADVVAGDLNNDGVADLVAVDVRGHRLELLAYDGETGLKSALSFQVFEEKSFGGRGAAGVNPREVLIVDVTGDSRQDLVVLVHDRILVYPQDKPE